MLPSFKKNITSVESLHWKVTTSKFELPFGHNLTFCLLWIIFHPTKIHISHLTVTKQNNTPPPPKKTHKYNVNTPGTGICTTNLISSHYVSISILFLEDKSLQTHSRGTNRQGPLKTSFINSIWVKMSDLIKSKSRLTYKPTSQTIIALLLALMHRGCHVSWFICSKLGVEGGNERARKRKTYAHVQGARDQT